MRDRDVRQSRTERTLRSIFRIDALLLAILILGWILIVGVANLGLYRVEHLWLPVNPVARVYADYSVDAPDAPRLAQVNPDIIEAVKQDALRREALKTPTTAVVLPDVTPTVSPTPSLTPTPFDEILVVSIGGPYEGEEGSPVSLTAENFSSALSYLPGGVTYRWDLNGDGNYNDEEGATISKIFFDEGDYSVSVQATDLLGRIATDSTVVNVINVPPTVDAGPTLYVSESRPLFFSAVATDPGRDVLRYEWNFGDGSPIVRNTLRPQHIYWDNGGYVATLRVSDNDGGVASDSVNVFVGNLPPEVDAGPDKVVDEGSEVTFRGKASDPAEEFDTISYAWDFDYDGENFEPDIEGEVVSTTYLDGPAEVTAALEAKDEDGGETIDTVSVLVRNVAPVITRVSSDGPKGEGSPINLVVEATDVGADTLTFAFDWDNDGVFDTEQGTNSISNVWFNQGEYTVGIRVDDGDGGEAFATTLVSTFNLTPTAVAQLPSGTYFEGSSVPFNGSESSDPGRNDSLTYRWNFGDGSTGNGVSPTHTYGDNGVYTATLVVIDDSGATDTDSVGVTILNANPTAKIGDVNLPNSEREAFEKNLDKITFVANNVSDPGDDALTIEWDFDYDGVNFTTDATGGTVEKTLAEEDLDGPAEFVVALRVRDDDFNASAPPESRGEFFESLTIAIKNNDPWEVDAGGPYLGLVNEPLTLSVFSAEDVPGDSLDYKWELPGGVVTVVGGDDEQPVIETIWSQTGSYDVKLVVTDDDGGETKVTAKVNIITNIDAGGPYTGVEGSPITFLATADPDDGDLTYTWDFGDGSSKKTGNPVTRKYADNGSYVATLTVKDSDGGTILDTANVTVTNAPPVADAGGPYTGNEGQAVSFDASASTDPGAADRDSLTYAWDFGDGNTSTEKTPTYAYEDNGTYNVTLTVTDKDGAENIDTTTASIDNVPPWNVDAGGPYFSYQGKPITLTGNAVDTAADQPSLQYAWDFNGDRTFEKPGQTVVYTPTNGGAYTVTLKVTDKDGAAITDTAQLNVNYIPKAIINGPSNGVEGTSITFDGSDSFDPDGGALSYRWSFGDRSPSQTGITTTHVYTDNGVYSVSLTVIDTDKPPAGNITTTLITIANAPPVADAGGPYTGNEGQAVSFDASASTDPGAADIDRLTFEWNFGDGSTSTEKNPTHTYDQDGNYTITLTVSDGDDSTTATQSIIIQNVAPTAVSAGGPYRATINVPKQLTGSGNDVPADKPLTFEWDFDYNGSNFNIDGTGSTVNHTWNTPGNYTVALRVSDDDTSVIATTTVDVGSPPIADAGGPYSVNEGTAVAFNGSGSIDPDGDPLTFEWNFGDGGTSTAQNPTHTYANNGSYNVSLTVRDNRGGVDTATTTVTVNNLPPTAAISAPNSGNEGAAISFSSDGSSDPNPNDTLTFEWDFGDGSTSTAQNPTHTYDQDGSYTVTLTVSDGDDFATATKTITINNIAPTAVSAGGPYRATINVPKQLTGSGNDVPADKPLTFEWDFDYDGSNFNVNGTGSSVNHTWNTPGNYTVALRVSDDDTSVLATTTVDVGSPPIADAGGPYSVNEGTAVAFNGSGSIDPDGDPLTFEWNFGDGGTSTAQNPTHTYANNGSYNVTLTVRDDRGGVGTATTTVTVNNLPPTAVISAPASGNEGAAISFSSDGSSDPNPNDTLSFEWDFGDGNTSTDPNPSHIYDQDGSYDVTLTVTDSDGAEDTTTQSITIQNVAPTADAGGSYSAPEDNPTINFDGSGSSDPGSDDNPLSYQWDFGDGNTSTEENPTHTYAGDDGTYNVTLTVTDSDGAQDTDTATVTISNIDPTADAGGPYSANVNETITLTGSGSDVAADTLQFDWDLDDDGAFETSGQNVDFTQAVSGTYTVVLRVRDGDGGEATDTTTVEVNFILPFAWLSLPFIFSRIRRKKGAGNHLAANSQKVGT